MSAKITAALHAVMQDVPYVQKTGVNQFHKYRYAGEADLLEKLRPALLRHGLLLIPSAEMVTPADPHGNVTVHVEYTLAHKDGDVWPEKIGAIGCGNDRSRDGKIGDKGLYKALTGANKYLLFKLFQIETGDDPETDEHHDAEAAKPPQKPQPNKQQATLPDVRTNGPVSSPSKAVYVENSLERIAGFESAVDLLKWAKIEREKVWPQYGIDAHDPDGQRIVKVYKDRMAVLESQSEAA
jgi:hypothetical protein